MSARAASVGLGPPTSRRERQAAALLNLSSTQVNSSTRRKKPSVRGTLKTNEGARSAVRPLVKCSSRRSASRHRRPATSSAKGLPRLENYQQANMTPGGETLMSPDRVKNVMRMAWYRLRATVRDSPNGVLSLGNIYSLCQKCLLGLTTEQLSSLLADAMGDASAEVEAQGGEQNIAFDDIVVKVPDALKTLEKHIQKQWDKVCRSVRNMSKSILLADAHACLLQHGLNVPLEQFCLLPEWTEAKTSNGLLTSRSEQILRTSRRGLSDRVESMLHEKIKRSWRRMNVEFRKLGFGRHGMIDVRQLNQVLSKFGIQLSHDDLVLSFNEFDVQGRGQIMYKAFLSKYVNTALGSPKGPAMLKINEETAGRSRKPPTVPRLQLKIKYPALEVDEEILKLLAEQ